MLFHMSNITVDRSAGYFDIIRPIIFIRKVLMLPANPLTGDGGMVSRSRPRKTEFYRKRKKRY